MNATDYMETNMSLALYRPNAKGTGTALRMGIHPAYRRIGGSGSLEIEIAAQNKITRDPKENCFDWDGKWTFRLSPIEVAEFLRVFCGATESISDGRGLYQKYATGEAFRICLAHKGAYKGDTAFFYLLEVHRVFGSEDSTRRFVFLEAEAVMLCEALRGSMARLCFA